jgi:copper chaperone CopZ
MTGLDLATRVSTLEPYEGTKPVDACSPTELVGRPPEAGYRVVAYDLTRRQVEFPKTHVIKRRLILLDPVDPVLAHDLDEANWLSPFGAEIRYPGDRPQMVPGDEVRAHQLAQNVRDAVMAVLARICRKVDLICWLGLPRRGAGAGRGIGSHPAADTHGEKSEGETPKPGRPQRTFCQLSTHTCLFAAPANHVSASSALSGLDFQRFPTRTPPFRSPMPSPRLPPRLRVKNWLRSAHRACLLEHHISMATQTLNLPVNGMTCGNCARSVERKLLATPGVKQAVVDLANGRAAVEYDAALVEPGGIANAVRQLGYEVSTPL